MALHRHWSVSAYADEEPKPVEAAPAPALTHVWVAIWETEDDGPEIRIFSTADGCIKWRQQIAIDNWNAGEEEPDDAEEMANKYFEFNECEEFYYHKECIR